MKRRRQTEVDRHPEPSWGAIAGALSGRGAESCQLDEGSWRFKIPGAFCETEKDIAGLFSDCEWVMANGGADSLVVVPRVLWDEYCTRLISMCVPQGYTQSLLQVEYFDTAKTIKSDKNMRWIIPAKLLCWFPSEARLIHLRVESAYIRILTAESYQADLAEAAKLRTNIQNGILAEKIPLPHSGPSTSIEHPDDPIPEIAAKSETVSKRKKGN